MWNRRQIWIRHILQIVRRCPWIIYQSLAGPSRLGIPRTAMCQVKLRTSQWEAGALSELDRWRQFQPIKELGECPTSLSILAWLERCRMVRTQLYPTLAYGVGGFGRSTPLFKCSNFSEDSEQEIPGIRLHSFFLCSLVQVRSHGKQEKIVRQNTQRNWLWECVEIYWEYYFLENGQHLS